MSVVERREMTEASNAVGTVRIMKESRRVVPASVLHPMTVRGLLTRFLVAGLLSTSTVVAITAFVSRRNGVDEALRDAERSTWTLGAAVIEPALSPEALSGDADALDALHAEVNRVVVNDSLLRVKLWRPDGTIVYASDSRLIGERFELDDEELEVLRVGGTHSGISDLSEPENRYEAKEVELVEVYSRVLGPNREALLFEAYFSKATVDEAGRQTWARYAPISLLAIVALQLAQIPIVWQLVRRLNGDRAERERLLRKVIDATDLERRRIAGDIHDGVVQDLSGVSYSLSATARATGLPSDVSHSVAESAERVRTAVQGLRSLLVDIYPSNLADDGLEVALGDLIARLAGHGLEASLDFDVSGETGEEATALLYRAAQESVRNVTKHARASHVQITVRRAGDCISMSVEDDGVGFDPTTALTRRADGHVGMQVLADIVNQAGGTVHVESAPGRGTKVVVEVSE